MEGGEGGCGKGQTEDPLRMGRDGDKPGAPVCTGPKQEEGTDMGRGRSSVLGGQGKRGRVWSPERGKKRVWVREGELTGDLPG